MESWQFQSDSNSIILAGKKWATFPLIETLVNFDDEFHLLYILLSLYVLFLAPFHQNNILNRTGFVGDFFI